MSPMQRGMIPFSLPLSVPRIVYILPEEVCPYANTVPLMPFIASSMIGDTSSTKMSFVDSDSSNTRSNTKVSELFLLCDLTDLYSIVYLPYRISLFTVNFLSHPDGNFHAVFLLLLTVSHIIIIVIIIIIIIIIKFVVNQNQLKLCVEAEAELRSVRKP